MAEGWTKGKTITLTENHGAFLQGTSYTLPTQEDVPTDKVRIEMNGQFYLVPIDKISLKK